MRKGFFVVCLLDWDLHISITQCLVSSFHWNLHFSKPIPYYFTGIYCRTRGAFMSNGFCLVNSLYFYIAQKAYAYYFISVPSMQCNEFTLKRVSVQNLHYQLRGEKLFEWKV